MRYVSTDLVGYIVSKRGIFTDLNSPINVKLCSLLTLADFSELNLIIRLTLPTLLFVLHQLKTVIFIVDDLAT